MTRTGTSTGDREAITFIEASVMKLVQDRLGIRLQEHQLPELRRGLAAAATARGVDAAGLLALLTADTSVSDALAELVPEITIGESYFFRDARQMAWLTERWVPALIRRRQATGQDTVRVWSAGCSEGQELYSVAILLLENLPQPETWKLHLVGTDISNQALASARRGLYSPWSLRSTDDAVRGRWFEEDGDRARVRQIVRDRVVFRWLNLASQAYPDPSAGLSALDLILCRNVFIYFEAASILAVLGRFGQALASDGRIMLGVSDVVPAAVEGLRLKEEHGAFLYVREDSAPVEPAPSRPRGRPGEGSSRSTARHQRGSGVARIPSRRARREISTPSPSVREDTTERALELAAGERWLDAGLAADRAMAARGPSAVLLRVKAQAVASLGEPQAALALCKRGLELDPLDAAIHGLLSDVLLEVGRIEDAEAAARKALYLARKDPTQHVRLGRVLAASGRVDEGQRNLRNALRLTEARGAGEEVPGMPGMTYGRLAAALRRELGAPGAGGR